MPCWARHPYGFHFVLAQKLMGGPTFLTAIPLFLEREAAGSPFLRSRDEALLEELDEKLLTSSDDAKEDFLEELSLLEERRVKFSSTDETSSSSSCALCSLIHDEK